MAALFAAIPAPPPTPPMSLTYNYYYRTTLTTRRQQQQQRSFTVLADSGDRFPSFLPEAFENIKDSSAQNFANRIRRVPVNFADHCIMSSCVKPLVQKDTPPVVLLHGFDSSCFEWRYTYPLLEEAGLETWAIDILGWGFSDLETLPSCDVVSKRNHFYQLWKYYIKRPMVLVGASLGAAVAIDFASNYPEAVKNLVLLDASVYTEGTGKLSKLPRGLAYAGVSLLKSLPLRLYVNSLAFNDLSFQTVYDWTNVSVSPCLLISRLHTLYPWWKDTTVDFMISGGYNVISQIQKVKQKTLIIWGEDDKIISFKFAVRLHSELPNAKLRQIPDCGHLPHIQQPSAVCKLITQFVRENCYNKEVEYVPKLTTFRVRCSFNNNKHVINTDVKGMLLVLNKGVAPLPSNPVGDMLVGGGVKIEPPAGVVDEFPAGVGVAVPFPVGVPVAYTAMLSNSNLLKTGTNSMVHLYASTRRTSQFHDSSITLKVYMQDNQKYDFNVKY
ncbi:hypothetical protein ACFE04_025369 [Oxalis oulophora]